ncbi:PIG-L deacetylase family protein [Thalassobacillus sp. CUG 92003]|uniref:PIG-L deacetylase family protein n=1 Tax=Thalassobacillus sp. CUG 92003 TaxID=2736641 RepID=UPI0015E73584|nr:PIG-L family deacetylase [Thalassobacillus sp. CUG 92003]
MMKQRLMTLAKPVVTPVTKAVLKRHYQNSKALSELGDVHKVVVVAPHMDDETIGAGGTILKHVARGDEVYCIFTTDGAGSESGYSREQLSQMRKEEMARVNEILNMTNIYYMDLPDGNVQSDADSQKALSSILESISPDVIYCTPFVDAHPDHVASTHLLADVLRKTNVFQPIVRLYEINCPIPPDEINCIIDISDTFDQKLEAIAQFNSQVIAFDGFIELNRLKTNLVPNQQLRAVEGFIELSSDEFVTQSTQLQNEQEPFHEWFKQANRTVTLLWAIYKNYPQKKRIYRERLSCNTRE